MHQEELRGLFNKNTFEQRPKGSKKYSQQRNKEYAKGLKQRQFGRFQGQEGGQQG